MLALNLVPALLLLLRGVAAVPAPTIAARADVLAPTAAWISVNKKGVPTTVTPKPTTISGTPTLLSAAPNALTGSVFTVTDFHLVKVITSTGSPPLATAKSKNGAGAFAPCSNKAGDFSPFCEPAKGSELYAGTTYYVTWDPTVLVKGNKTNVLVKIQGKEVNGTKVGEIVLNEDTDKTSPASYGFYAWNVNKNLIPGGQANTTIELLLTYTIDGVAQKEIKGPQVTVGRRQKYQPQSAKMPESAELYIALPIVFGVIILTVIGGFVWNRRVRKIGLGNIMSRSRHGYGAGRSRAQRLGARMRKSMFRGGNEQGILLKQRDSSPDVYVFHDDPSDQRIGRPRRDSDGLGSLAGSPTSDRFQDQGVHGGNVFRDELKRQDRERY